MLQRLFSSYEEGPYATVSVIKSSRSLTCGEVTVSRQSLMARLGNFSPDDVVRLTQYKNNDRKREHRKKIELFPLCETVLKTAILVKDKKDQAI